MLGLLAAAAGVAVLTITRGQLPWIALALACSFGGYGLVRKLAHVGPLIGVGVETAMLIPVAAAYVIFVHAGDGIPALAGSDLMLLSVSGVVTVLPLLWFTAATRRLRLSTMGFLQYVGPTCQFLLAVFAFGERFSTGTLVGFCLIWSACVIYSLDSLRAYRAARDEQDKQSAAAPLAEM